ncbi:MAG: hypothetical protein GY953_28135, partial [bacterium]|nr:hypothetical protein [bacterium]
EITDKAIGESLKVYNEVRRLSRSLYDYRSRHPGSITSAELCTITQGGTRMMPEDLIPLLEQVNEGVRKREVHPLDSVNVVIEGAFCEQPPIGLIEVLETAGCQVKDDDMIIGWRLFGEDVCADGDPLGALAEAYIQNSAYTSVRHDYGRPRTEGLIRRMKDAGADAVIFAPAKFCEPALLDYVLYLQRLDQDNIPHLKLEFEEKMWTFEASRTEVETFAESMLFD